MNAVKIEVVIPENRELRVSLPPDVAPGPAEVIVLSERRAQTTRGSWERIRQYLERTPPASPGKSKDEMDRYLAEERASWDGDE